MDNFGSVKLSYFRPRNTFCTFPYVGTAKLSSRRFYRELLFSGGITIMPNGTFNRDKRNFVHYSCTCSIRDVSGTLREVRSFLGTGGLLWSVDSTL